MDDLAEAARELLDDSARLLELQRLTVESADKAEIPRQAARASVSYAEVVSLWRDRARAILKKASNSDNISSVYQPAFDELEQQMGSGRLNLAEFARCLRESIDAARSFELPDHEAPLRSQLIGNAAVSPEEAATELEALDYLHQQADHNLYELHLTVARAKRALVEDREKKSKVLAERGLELAADLYRRAPDSERTWIAGAAANLANITERPDLEQRWWQHQLETLRRLSEHDAVAVITPLELAAAADDLETMRYPGRADSTARIGKLRRLVELSETSVDEGSLPGSVEYLREAYELIPNEAEWTPLAFELERRLSQQLFALADQVEDPSSVLDDALEFWERAGESAVILGRCRLACETLSSLILDAHRHGREQFWEQYQQMMDLVTRLQSVELLDEAFDLSINLLRRSQSSPVLGQAEADQIEVRIQQFILDQTPVLRELGAKSLLDRWDVTLSSLTDTTKPLSIPQHLRHP